MKPSSYPTILLKLAVLLLPLIGISCGDDPAGTDPRSLRQLPASFTFFDIGKNSILSNDLRRDLKNNLGDYSSARSNTISLEIHRKGFLARYFKELNGLNLSLNTPVDRRVEHRTTKLMFRHITGRYASFDYVEFLFSEYTKTPVIIRFAYRHDELAVVDALKQKYGAPTAIDWPEESAKILYWQKAGDYLIHTAIPDRSGTLHYQIAIYYVERLRELIQAEQTAKERARQKGIDPAKSAF